MGESHHKCSSTWLCVASGDGESRSLRLPYENLALLILCGQARHQAAEGSRHDRLTWVKSNRSRLFLFGSPGRHTQLATEGEIGPDRLRRFRLKKKQCVGQTSWHLLIVLADRSLHTQASLENGTGWQSARFFSWMPLPVP